MLGVMREVFKIPSRSPIGGQLHISVCGASSGDGANMKSISTGRNLNLELRMTRNLQGSPCFHGTTRSGGDGVSQGSRAI